MNAMRWLAAAAVVCLVTAGAHADAKADNAKLIVGKWEVTKSETIPVGSTVEFTKDGKIKLSFKADDKDMSLEGTYKVDGDKFTLTMKNGDQEVSQTITIKKLSETEFVTMNEMSKSVEMKKKK